MNKPSFFFLWIKLKQVIHRVDFIRGFWHISTMKTFPLLLATAVMALFTNLAQAQTTAKEALTQAQSAYLRGDMTPLERWLIGAALVAVITWLNVRGIRLVGLCSIIFTFIVLAPFAALIALCVPRIGCALERGCTVAESRTSAQTRIELVFPERKLVGRGARKVLRQLPLRGGEHTHDKVPAADEGIRAACIVTDAPENQRWIERHRRE